MNNCNFYFLYPTPKALHLSLPFIISFYCYFISGSPSILGKEAHAFPVVGLCTMKLVFIGFPGVLGFSYVGFGASAQKNSNFLVNFVSFLLKIFCNIFIILFNYL